MNFDFDLAPIGLPAGAWAATHRRLLRLDGKPLLGLTQGAMRACVGAAVMGDMLVPRGTSVTRAT